MNAVHDGEPLMERTARANSDEAYDSQKASGPGLSIHRASYRCRHRDAGSQGSPKNAVQLMGVGSVHV